MNSTTIAPPAARPRGSSRLRRTGLGLLLVAGLFAGGALRAQEKLDDSWTVTVNGKSIQVNPDGTFLISNISAPDQFGTDGPGSRPDFIGDNFLRLNGSRTINGRTRYVFSEPFLIRRGETYAIGDLTFTDFPPPLVESLRAVVSPQVLTQTGQLAQVTVTARLADGTTNDVTPRAHYSIYRSSNLGVADIDRDGRVTAKGAGTAYLTVVNEGATAVVQLDVSPGDPLTSVTGFVRDTNGLPVVNASVTLLGLGLTGFTDPEGRFTLVGVPTRLGPIVVQIVYVVDGRRFVGRAQNLEVVGGGITDAGIVVLQPSSPVGFFTDFNNTVAGLALSIVRAGMEAQRITNIATANFNDFSMVIIHESSNGSISSELRNRLGDLTEYVASGGRVIVHDRFRNGATVPNELVLGYPTTPTTRLATSAVDVLAGVTNLLLQGPGGVITDATLDGGNSSAHGYTERADLPPGAEPSLTHGGQPTRIVDFSYPYGAGFVHYSTIPLDCYVFGGGCSGTTFGVNATNIYLLNLLAYVANLTSVPAAPSFQLQPRDQVVALSSNVLFLVSVSGNPAPRIEWLFNDSPIPNTFGRTLLLSNVSPAQAGSYRATASNTLGGAISTAALLTVTSSPPVITSQPQGRDVDEGSFVTLSVGATGIPNPGYQWFLNGSPIGAATAAFWSFTASPSTAGTYFVRVTNLVGAVQSSDAVVIVRLRPPAIFSGPADVSATVGEFASLGVSVSGTAPLFFTWYRDGVVLPTQLSSQINFNSITPADAGAYQVVITNVAGAVTSRVATVTVRQEAAAILAQPRSLLVRTGLTYTLNVALAGLPRPTVFWGVAGQPPELVTTDSPRTLTAPATPGTLTYSFVASNATGVATSAPITMVFTNSFACEPFRITSLTTNHPVIVDHNALTGDDNGGIAASLSRIYYNGDNSAAAFTTGLSNGVALQTRHEHLVSDLKSGVPYVMAETTNFARFNQQRYATELRPLDDATGRTNGTSIPLSAPIPIAGGMGFFAGYGQIVVISGSDIFQIALPSGQVSQIQRWTFPSRQSAENNGSFWGVAECIAGQIHIAYVQNSSTIARMRIADATVSTLATFSDLSDAAAFTVVPGLGRWFFHYEGGGEFGGFSETLGAADATFSFDP